MGGYYDIEYLLKRRKSMNGTSEYLVRWKNYSPLDDSWEPAENINNNELLQALDNVYQRYEQGQADEWKKLKYMPLKILSDDVVNNELVFLTIIKDKDDFVVGQELVSAAYMYRHWPHVAQTHWDQLYDTMMKKIAAKRPKEKKPTGVRSDPEKKTGGDARKKRSRVTMPK